MLIYKEAIVLPMGMSYQGQNSMEDSYSIDLSNGILAVLIGCCYGFIQAIN